MQQGDVGLVGFVRTEAMDQACCQGLEPPIPKSSLFSWYPQMEMILRSAAEDTMTLRGQGAEGSAGQRGIPSAEHSLLSVISWSL